MYLLTISILLTICATLLSGLLTVAVDSSALYFQYPELYPIGFFVWALGNLLYLVPTLIIIRSSATIRHLLAQMGDSESKQLYVIPLIGTLLVALPGIDSGNIFMTSTLRCFLLVISCLAGALYQEVLFRGVIQSLLLARGAIGSTLLTALFFSLWHIGRYVQGTGHPLLVIINVLWTLVWGIGASALRIRSTTLVPLVLLHTLHNILDALVYTDIHRSWVASLSFEVRWGIFLMPSVLMGSYGIWLLRYHMKIRHTQ